MVLRDFVSFLKHPKDVQTKESFKRKLQIIFILLVGKMCVFCFVLMPLNDLVEHFVSTDSKLDLHKKSITSAIFIAVVLAPVFEEIGFRLILRRIFPIKYIFSQKLWDRIFPFLVYASSVIFGFGHLTNYTNDGFWFLCFFSHYYRSSVNRRFGNSFYPSEIQFLLRNTLSFIMERITNFSIDFYK